MNTLPTIDLRPLTPADLATVGPWLEAAGLGVPEGACHKVWGERLRTDPGICCRVALQERRVAGLYRLDLAPDHTAELTILVGPHLRRRGVGHAILAAAVHQARCLELRQVFAAVHCDNHAGHAFFAAAGFAEGEERIPGYRYFERELGHAAPRLEATP